MASFVLTSAGIWLDEFNLQGDFNTVSIASEVEEKDATVFGDTTRVMKGGLKTVAISGAGFWDANATTGREPDDVIYPRVGAGSTALTIAPETTAEGKRALFVQPNVSRYEFSPQIGEIKPFSLSAVAKDGPLVSGTIMHNGTQIASGVGTAYQLGAVGASQKLYAALHITAANNLTGFTVKVQSDDASGFATPTDRITFATATGSGVQWATPVSGSIADTWWRITWDINGTSPTASFLVVVGIL